LLSGFDILEAIVKAFSLLLCRLSALTAIKLFQIFAVSKMKIDQCAD